MRNKSGHPRAKQASARRFAITALKTTLAITALWLAARHIEVRGIGAALLRVDLVVLGASVSLHFVLALLNAARWRLLLGDRELGLGKYLYYVFVGHFFAFFLPSSAMAEAVRVVAFGRRYGGVQRNIGVALVGRGVGAVVQLVFGAAALAFYYRELSRSAVLDNAVAGALWAGAACIAVVVAAFAIRRWLVRQTWLATVLEVLRDRPLLTRTVGLTVLIQCVALLSGYLLYKSIIPDATFWKVTLFILIIQAILMLPFSLGGVGVREYLVVVFFAGVGGFSADASLAANLLGYIPGLMLALLGGAWILYRRALMSREGDD